MTSLRTSHTRASLIHRPNRSKDRLEVASDIDSLLKATSINDIMSAGPQVTPKP